MFANANIFCYIFAAMKKLILTTAIIAATLCGCEKTQCRNEIYNLGMYNYGVNINIDGKNKLLMPGKKIKVPYRSVVILDGKRYYTNDCGRIWTIFDNSTGDIKMQ